MGAGEARPTLRWHGALRHVGAYLLACLVAALTLFALLLFPFLAFEETPAEAAFGELATLFGLVLFWVAIASPPIALPTIWWMRRTGHDRAAVAAGFGALAGGLPMLVLTGFEPGYAPIPYFGALTAMAAGATGAVTYMTFAPLRTAAA